MIAQRRVLLLGSGGREHAIASALASSPRCAALFVAPGNPAMPGTHVDVRIDDPLAVVAAAQQMGVDLVVIGPETCLAVGVTDALAAVGIDAFGPSMAAAELETSKIASRAFCERHAIAVPMSRSFGTPELDDAIAWVKTLGVPMVVKADGLAGGKGVVVAASVDETIDAIRAALGDGRFGRAGSSVLIEEVLVGEEVSLLAFCDGSRAVPMLPAQDHKRIHEGDRGLNTGGMGAYAPAPICPPDLVAQLTVDVLQKAVDGCKTEGRPYTGVLYAGLMLTAAGPRLIEFNARFGDPESQALLPLLETDLLEVMEACIEGRLDTVDVRFSRNASCAVVLAAAGYPHDAQLGAPIAIDQSVVGDAYVFHGGTRRTADESLVVSGGRVLTVVGVGASFEEARAKAYSASAGISFNGQQKRRDIGWRAVARTTGGYAASGVDIDEGNRAVDLIKQSVSAAQGPSVLSGVGGFGGVFDVSALKHFEAPVLVASTDGVGTKVALAAEAGRLRGVGMDLVNHCVNDVLVQNARPLFFLDYIASSHIDAEQVADIVGGMSDACVLNGCALLGGETAEMPGVYHDGHVDVAGTLIGAADRKELLPREGHHAVVPGDILIGIQSSGPHTNGYSLLRRMFSAMPLDAMPAPLEVPLGDALLEPHRSYLPVLRELLDGPNRQKVKALAHITGGGLIENLPRVLPAGTGADVMVGSWPVPPLFCLIRDASGLHADELHRTLNMGIGMVIVCAPEDQAIVQASIDEPVWRIGAVVDRDTGEVTLR